MSAENTMIEQTPTKELAVEQEFQAIVADIERAGQELTAEEMEELVRTPVAKAAGSSDQGYRFD